MPLPRPLARQGPAFPVFGTPNLDGRRHRPGVAQGVRAQGAARQSAVVLQRRADRRPARPAVPRDGIGRSRISRDTSLAAEATRSPSHWPVPCSAPGLAAKRALSRPGELTAPIARGSWHLWDRTE